MIVVPVFVVVITPFPGAAPVVIDDVATAADGAALVLAYKRQVDSLAVGAVLPVNKRARPTVGVAP